MGDRSFVNLKDDSIKFWMEVQKHVSRQCQIYLSPDCTHKTNITTLADFDKNFAKISQCCEICFMCAAGGKINLTPVTHMFLHLHPKFH